MKPMLLFLHFLLYSIAQSFSPCERRHFVKEHPQFVVCMCNATYCDDFPPLGNLVPDTVAVYETSSSGKRFDRSTISWTSTNTRKHDREVSEEKMPKSVKISIDPDLQMQTIIGFGGAFTDSAGLNIASVEHDLQEQIMMAYFGPNGNQYTLGRVVMASSDFSTHEYSYDDMPDDFELKLFALTPEDTHFKMPYIKRAVELTGGDIKLFCTPWSAPGWMKDTGRMKGGGELKGPPGGPYHQAYAKYLLRFLEEYDKNGIKFWGMTVLNQPGTAKLPDIKWQSMYFSAETERDFIRDSLAPLLQNSTLGRDIALMICDDQRPMVQYWADVMFADPVINSLSPGISVHWYLDMQAPVSVYTKTHNAWPNKFILSTEACVATKPVFGNWTNADKYSHSIISNLNNWVAGWTDWNLALDVKGGPNWVNNLAESSILIDAEKGEFYKQPMYYIMGHFSKFIRPGSIRIGVSMEDDEQLEGVAFTTPDNLRVVVVRNNHTQEYDLEIDITDRPNQALHVTIEPESIITIVWNKVDQVFNFAQFVI